MSAAECGADIFKALKKVCQKANCIRLANLPGFFASTAQKMRRDLSQNVKFLCKRGIIFYVMKASQSERKCLEGCKLDNDRPYAPCLRVKCLDLKTLIRFVLQFSRCSFSENNATKLSQKRFAEKF